MTSDGAVAGSLSARGAGLAEGGLSDYIRVHFERQGDPGYVGLCVAENHQVRGLLRDRLQQPLDLPDHVLGYDAMGGKAGLREATADLFARHVVHRPVDPEHVKVLSGAGAVLESLAYALGDPGDVVLVPTPSYAGFWPDLQIRPGLQIHPVHTTAEEGFQLTPAHLDRTLADAPGTVRAMLLTNPDNPRGEVVDASAVTAVLDWADRHQVHVIADEIYALSVHGGTPFTSVGALRPQLGDRVHIVWAVSKDFGASGLRCGMLISENQPLLDAIELQGVWGGVSGHTQHLLAAVLGDRDWVEGYLAAMRAGLAASAAAVRDVLHTTGIPHTAGDAGFFVLADLRAHLDAPTWEAEDRLWRNVLDRTGVNLTPGSACRAVEPGFFRICHASNPIQVVEDALRRVAACLRA
ncbi:pyridoxal phosphate-dependent aminotransferase [soil metagenome]